MVERFVFETVEQLGAAAAADAATRIVEAIGRDGQANIILATGASQFATLDALVGHTEIDFSRVVMFHLDEYIGLDDQHPASFRRYLRERFVDRVGPLAAVHWVQGDAPDPQAECDRLGRIIAEHPIDVALIGIGENGHLAFNDPPADFGAEQAFLVVELDERCRRQQLGEGWFDTLEDVPRRAISMGIRQILRSRSLIVSVPDERKAQAVRNALEGPVTNQCPASILREHGDCRIYLDRASASLLGD